MRNLNNLAEISFKKKEFMGANPYTQLAIDGLVGLFITWLPVFYLFRVGVRYKKYIGVAFICVVGFLQRPYDCTQLLYPLLLYSICLWAYWENNIKDICKKQNI